MAKFTFRLEKVWRHRKRGVEQQSLEVARCERQVAVLARRIAGLDEDIWRQSDALASASGQTLRPRDLIAGTSWLDHLHRGRETLATQMNGAMDHLAEARRQLDEAWRELEVLTRLKAKQKADWEEDLQRRERREMDEIGQVRAFRHGPAIVSGSGEKYAPDLVKH